MSDNFNEENEWGIPEEKVSEKEGRYDFDKTANMPDHEVTVDLTELAAASAPVNEEYANAPEQVELPESLTETVSEAAPETEQDIMTEAEPVKTPTSPVKTVPPVTPPDDPDDGESEKEAKDKKAFIISAIAALVLIIIVGVYILAKLIGAANPKPANTDNDYVITDVTENTNSAGSTESVNTATQDTTGDDKDSEKDKDKEKTPAEICAEQGHTYTEATCTKAQVCTRCGAINGKPLGHDYSEATCTEPATCSRCGETGTEALGHDYAAATCTEPKKCKRCGATEGEALGHDYKDATCTEPKTCTRCGATEGEALGHDYAAATCSAPSTCKRCGATTGSALEHSYVVTSTTIDGTNKTVIYTCSVCGATKSETTQVPASESSSAANSYIAEVVNLVNADRAANGLSPVTATTELNQAAAIRAQEIVNLFDHTRPDGTSCFTVLSQCNVPYMTAGENIAAGQTSPSAVETAWMNSPGHRQNILTAGYTHIGVGYYETSGGYRYYWVQLFTD